MLDDLSGVARKAIDQALSDRGHVTVLIAGRSGVGKSTLINAMFQGNMAETGQGRPVTRTTREITKEGVPLTLLDTRGLEMAAFGETLAELERVISSRRGEHDPRRHIHVAWVCVAEDARRIEPGEIALHEMLARHMPVLGVITKARSDQGYRQTVLGLLPHCRNVVRVRAIPETLDDGHTLPPAGLAELVEATGEVVPDGHRRAFAAAQRASLAYKRKIARGVILTASTTAAAAGASPVPFSDAFLLVPIQLGMMAGITATFGIEMSAGFVSTVLASAMGATGTTVAGRALVAGLLKLFPGLGTATGAMLSGATAAAMTTALGEAYTNALVTVLGRTDKPEAREVADELARELERGGAGAG